MSWPKQKSRNPESRARLGDPIKLIQNVGSTEAECPQMGYLFSSSRGPWLCMSVRGLDIFIPRWDPSD